MTNDREVSDLTLNVKECGKCGATWIDGRHVWRGTGNSYDTSELDLAGLVCNNHGDETCINPCVGMEGGVTWQKRLSQLDEDESQNG